MVRAVFANDHQTYRRTRSLYRHGNGAAVRKIDHSRIAQQEGIQAPIILVSLECGHRRGCYRHRRHQQRIEATRPRRDPRHQIGAGGPQVDVLDGGHPAGALDPGPDARVIVAAAPLQQRLVPSISLDRRKPASGIYRCKLGQFAEW